MKPGVRELDFFLRGEFSKSVRESYEKLLILSEADLQAHAWNLLVRFFDRYNPNGASFRVLNKPYFKDVGIHPDVGIFKRRKPWVLFELKERKRVTAAQAAKERKRLLDARRHLKPKRAYFIYVTRYGTGEALSGPKGAGAKFFYEIPISLEQYWNGPRILKWEKEFNRWSKFAVQN